MRANLLFATATWLIFPLCASTCAARPPFAGLSHGASGSSPARKAPLAAGGLRQATLGGASIVRSVATTSLLYAGACSDLSHGVWSPKAGSVADSLNGYPLRTSGPYLPIDQTREDPLWHVVDVSLPTSQRPVILDGARSLWCGRYDPSWKHPVGYPNLTFQILYIDTGAHAADYSLSLIMNASLELNFDFVYLAGGGAGAVDPIGNSHSMLETIIALGAQGDSRLLVTWTGSTTPTGALDGSGAVSGGARVEGSGESEPVTASVLITGIRSTDRALYFVVKSDDLFSSQDGLWPFGSGVILDRIATSDHGMLYDDQLPAGGTDGFAGNVILGAPNAPILSARAQPSVGAFWQLDRGSDLVTEDPCSPQKERSTDLIFLGADPITLLTVPGMFSSLVTCPVPVPPGTASLTARWSLYRDLATGSGFVHYAEYRFFKDGAWSLYEFIPASATAESNVGWTYGFGGALPNAVYAESVQVRFSLRCIPFFSVDHVNCQAISYGVLLDDFAIIAQSGDVAPQVDLTSFTTPQSTFVDGTMTGLHCAAPPCWPGIRGSDLSGAAAIHDNVNSPAGDSCVVLMLSPLREHGMGLNWRLGFNAYRGSEIGFTRRGVGDGFRPEDDVPRCIFRLFDPTTKTWSPFDSSELIANAVAVAGADTILFRDEFRFVWPPWDKLESSLPGGFAVNGHTEYGQLAFLPRGARMQYYFKAVDIQGRAAYGFIPSLGAPHEGEDLPTLPSGTAKAPDIMEFDVLPRVYAPGSSGSLLAGRTSAAVLNLDGAYTRWGIGLDPVTTALRGLGVRADRYRALDLQTFGAGIGGHELPGERVAYPSNFFPNLTEYGIKDSLAAWYRILIDSNGESDASSVTAQDARLLTVWWNAPTGNDGGDRCILASGDNLFSMLLSASPGLSTTEQRDLASSVFGVSTAGDAWTGAATNPYPVIDDRFAGGGPGLGPAGTFTYPVDGGCPNPNRFDGLFKTSSATVAVLYPGGVAEAAGIANFAENDPVPDHDRSKAIAYAFSIESIRRAGIAPSSTNYVHSGAELWMRVLYKFLTSCRGPRSAGGTGVCWPCPSDPQMAGNWAVLGGFETATYGPLYAIQDPAVATGVEPEAIEPAPAVNALGQNRPNPFNPATIIPYSLASPGRVAIRIFDVGGRCVRILFNRKESPGTHAVPWDGKLGTGAQAPSGIYFYRIEYPDGSVSSKKMAMLR